MGRALAKPIIRPRGSMMGFYGAEYYGAEYYGAEYYGAEYARGRGAAALSPAAMLSIMR